MAELRHAVIAALGCFVLLIAAAMSAVQWDALQWPVLAAIAAVSGIAAVADVVIRRKRGVKIE
jgi:hypothetical protein